MKNLHKYIIIVLLTFLAINACKKDDHKEANATNQLIKMGESYAIGASAKVELWSDTDFKPGFNKIYIAVFDSVSNKRITDSHIKIKPMMIMQKDGMTKTHSSPCENPETSQAVNGLFPAAVVFTMPGSGETGKWLLEAEVHNHINDKRGKAIIPLTVTALQEAKITFATSSVDNVQYIISYIAPQKPKVGINDLEILIHKKVDGMTYPFADDLNIEITPEMPDMGHGSPNNINPLHIKNGHYKGKVNFTMTGRWIIKLVLKDRAGRLIADNALFNITF